MKKNVLIILLAVLVATICLMTSCNKGEDTFENTEDAKTSDLSTQDQSGNTEDAKTSDLSTQDQSGDANSSINDDKNVKPDKIIEFESGVYFDKNWEETVGTYEGNVVPTKEIAISIAQAIFDGLENVGNIADYVIQEVFYDEEDHVWVVSFWPEMEDPDEAWVGGDCSIAIQQTDGKVLRIWFGE